MFELTVDGDNTGADPVSKNPSKILPANSLVQLAFVVAIAFGGSMRFPIQSVSSDTYQPASVA